MPGRDRLATGDESQAGVTAQAPANDPSADGPVQHHVRTQAGLVSLTWDPEQVAFVAARGQQTWCDARLGDLARTVGMKVPASVARDLRRDERLHPGPRVQIRAAYNPPPVVRGPDLEAQPPAPAPPAVPPPWPPASTYLVPSRRGQLAVAWAPADRCYTAVTASGHRWLAEQLDDLAIKAGARIPRAYVEDLLRDAGRPLPTWDPPPAEAGKEWAEWQAAPVAVPALLDGLPPGVAEKLKPALAAPSQTEPDGVARVETARRAVRAEWGAWANEAGARGRLIEDLGSLMRSLAWGELLHQTVQRLEDLAERYSRQVDIERSPTIGAHARANQDAIPSTPTTSPMNRLHALRSRPAASSAAVGRS
jgi:hypothetical protein